MVQASTIMMVIGAALIILGVIWQLGGSALPFGRLPGDIRVERPGFRFYFPITTSILISVLISLIFLAISFFRR